MACNCGGDESMGAWELHCNDSCRDLKVAVLGSYHMHIIKMNCMRTILHTVTNQLGNTLSTKLYLEQTNPSAPPPLLSVFLFTPTCYPLIFIAAYSSPPCTNHFCNIIYLLLACFTPRVLSSHISCRLFLPLHKSISFTTTALLLFLLLPV